MPATNAGEGETDTERTYWRHNLLYINFYFAFQWNLIDLKNVMEFN